MCRSNQSSLSFRIANNKTGKVVIAHGSVRFCEATPNGLVDASKKSFTSARRTETCVAPRHADASRDFIFYYERSELLINGDGKKSTQGKSTQKKRTPSPSSLEILPASDSELCPRRSSGVRLAYTDPSGERQRAPSTPQQWGPPSLHRSFRRATASTAHVAVGSV